MSLLLCNENVSLVSNCVNYVHSLCCVLLRSFIGFVSTSSSLITDKNVTAQAFSLKTTKNHLYLHNPTYKYKEVIQEEDKFAVLLPFPFVLLIQNQKRTQDLSHQILQHGFVSLYEDFRTKSCCVLCKLGNACHPRDHISLTSK